MVHVVAIRRYPVKSMGGEALTGVELDARGLVGDRAFAVSNLEGRFASGKNTKRFRRHDEVFAFAARTMADAVVVSGAGGEWSVGQAGLDAALSDALGQPMRVTAEAGVPHFDDGAVSVVGTATLAWCERELGVDPDARRLRVNVVVQTSEPFEEESWEGAIVIGGSGSGAGRGSSSGAREGSGSGAVLRTVQRIERCRTIDLPQDGVRTRTRWLKPLGDARDARVGIYCDVAIPGTITVGDQVRPG